MSSALLASSLLHSSLPFPPPKSPLFSSYTQHRNKVQFAKQPTPTTISSRTTPSNTLNLSKRTDRLTKFQDLVTIIRSLPTTQRTRIANILKTVDGFQTISDFNDLFMALVSVNELELALTLYSNLSSYGLVPNCWTYSIMIRYYCKKNEPNEAKTVVDQMIENGYQPNVSTFTGLINSFSRVGRVQKAEEVLEIMGRIKCEPTIQTYNCLLKGLCYVGKVEKALELLMNIKKSSKRPDIYTYTVVMDGLCKVGRSDEAFELLEEALEMGLTPNVATFNTLFTGYCREGRPLEGICLLNQMREKNCVPDYITYSTLLHGLLKWGQIRTAVEIYKEMVGIGFQVDERMMNTLLRGLIRRSRTENELLKDAYEVFDKMSSWEFVVYDFTYDLVIEAFCLGGDAEKALVSLQDMVGVGYVPKKSTFNNVVRALCEEGKVEEALSVLVMCGGSGIPSRVCFNVLINEFNRQGKQWVACNVYGAALKLGVIPEREPRKRLAINIETKGEIN